MPFGAVSLDWLTGDTMPNTTSFRTIAVPLPAPQLAERLMPVAIPLASATQAVVVGIHATPPMIIYANGAVGMVDYVAEQQKTFRETARATAAKFRAVAESARVRHEWHEEDSGVSGEPASRSAVRLCRAADLIVTGQPDEANPITTAYNPADLVLGTGRPVLIVPFAGQFGDVGK